MSTKLDLGKVFFVILLLVFSTMTALAGTIRGTVTDKQTGEPLTGATVQVVGTTQGVIADLDGNFTMEVANGTYTLQIRYVGYKDVELASIKVGSEPVVLNIAMESDAQALGEVSVTARKNLEGERALQLERKQASLAIENLGAKEMSIKGISNVQEGVKQITGISIADAGQLIVRGLGDRYSTTTLNGLPIASPNPDNKLIPLDLFPSSTVQNITVSKVYDASVFADYSGAHIDISTKENMTDDFFNVSFNAGGKFNTLGKEFYRMDRGTLFKTPSLDRSIIDMNRSDFDSYVKEQNIFSTTFDVDKKNALPEFGGNIGTGKNFDIKGQTLSLLASFSLSNETQNIYDAFTQNIEAQGNVLDNFSYDEYTASLKMAGLASAGLTLRERDRIGYTFFYARNASNSYQRREGVDYEDNNLIGSNSVTHIYTLQNHQINGLHYFGKQWELVWGGSYGKTSSEEPDRRQVMFEKQNDGTLELFDLNQQETMRYFGTLNEEEWIGNLAIKYKWTENNFVTAGFSYKDKNRDFEAIRFHYDTRNSGITNIGNIYDTSGYLNQENIADGHIRVIREKYSNEAYLAGTNIYAGYVQTDFYPLPSLLVNIGLRYEHSEQWVRYAGQGDQRYSRRRDLNKDDIFPTVNLKYTMNDKNNLRLSVSRTVTRPSFVEMAPFEYQESYGSAYLCGNEELQNGYNYNLDLRYEHFGNNGDMFSITGYYKHLDKPIERTQTVAGGKTMHSFQNAEQGMAAGIEVEMRKQLVKDLRVGANVSYMYTNVKLPDGGVYTSKERSLQGASPILMNADLTYSPRFGEDKQLALSLLYNLQGKRIHAVGISRLGDIEQEAVHTMNFNAAYTFNSHFSVKLQVKDLLNRAIVFNQEAPEVGKTFEVERYKEGTSFEIGVSYTL